MRTILKVYFVNVRTTTFDSLQKTLMRLRFTSHNENIRVYYSSIPFARIENACDHTAYYSFSLYTKPANAPHRAKKAENVPKWGKNAPHRAKKAENVLKWGKNAPHRAKKAENVPKWGKNAPHRAKQAENVPKWGRNAPHRAQLAENEPKWGRMYMNILHCSSKATSRSMYSCRFAGIHVLAIFVSLKNVLLQFYIRERS
jgi:hypothetical protein